MRYALSFLVIHFFFTISMGLLANEKINFSSKRFYISFFITLFLLILNFEYSPSEIRVLFNFIIYVILAIFLFRNSLKESIILSMLVIIIGLLSEFLYGILTYPFFHYNVMLQENSIVSFFNNFVIGLTLTGLSNLKKTKGLFKNVLYACGKIEEKHIIIFSLIIVVLFNCIGLLSYYISIEVVDTYYLVFVGTFLCLFTSVLTFYYFKTQNNYLHICEKYNVSLESIREFELMIENYRINSHENKNQFRTIRNMSGNKKINSYIDALLSETVNDDEKILTDIQRIPAGGLRGIIYSKLLLMQQKEISSELVVDKKITTVKVSNIDDYTLTAICRILGVLLDNAIEGVKDLENRYIIVELYEEEKDLVISITNNYEGYVDIENISHPGISSKGGEHGYGLSLVQNLVRKNKKIQHTSEFFEDNFMQKIKIKV